MKHVVKYAVNAAYRLSLEASFLADEGATLPKMMMIKRTDVTKPDEHDVAIDDHMMMKRNAISSPCAVEEITPYESSISIEVTDDSNEYYPSMDNNQSILGLLSFRSVLNGNVCEQSRLLRI